MRTHPLLTSEPIRPGRFVPWMAIWPLPPPKLVSTSEKAATLTWWVP